MKLNNADPVRSHILGGGHSSSGQASDIVAGWLSRLGYFSLFAGAASVFTVQPRDVRAEEGAETTVPARLAKKARIISELNSCSKPELLRRQSEYRLPHQKASFDVTRVLAGGDNCPGTVIPAGTYTAAAPYTDTGDTTGANDTVSSQGCFYYYYYYTSPGPDHVYTFTLTARGANPRIEVTTTSTNYNPQIYILHGLTGERCSPGTSNYASNCLIASERTGSGGTETLDAGQMNRLPLNIPLHLFVDSAIFSGPNSSGPYTIRMQDVSIGPSAIPPSNDASLDLNGDGGSDFAISRNTGGGQSGQTTLFTRNSDNTFATPFDWGIDSDKFVMGDFDGDGRDDIAVWRPGAQGRFFILLSRSQTIRVEDLGQTGDDPTVVADYTGDGIDDLAVYRPGATPGAQSFWYYRPLGSTFFTSIPWGQHGDRPAPGNYDDFGASDFVVQRAEGANGRFYFRFNGYHGEISKVFGLAEDMIVPGKYLGGRNTILAVVRPGADGILVWDILTASIYGGKSHFNRRFWGVAATDIITPGDYDGDGIDDLSVWRPGSPGQFFNLSLPQGRVSVIPWGETGDRPVASFRTH